MAIDPRALKPNELVMLLNSSPLGVVIDARRLFDHRTRAGFRIGDGTTVDLLRYVAWLVEQRHSPKQEAQPADPYASMRERAAARNRRLAESGRDIGDLPAVLNPSRRDAARLSLRTFAESYFAQRFTLAWSPDHLSVIADIESCCLRGGQSAIAMPRGNGKTTICEVGAVWAMVYGHRLFVVLIGSSEAHGLEMLESISTTFESNDILAEDFPNVCFPIRALDGIANRCAGQLHMGERTHIVWTANSIVLPTVPGSEASGAIIRVAGLTGRLRGMKHQRIDGSTVRPDLAIIDDPQTDESARSVSQCAVRERIISGAVLGLSGPGEKIAAVMPCTVIRSGDMVDSILDRGKHPEWNGRRMKLVYAFPTSKLWDKYHEVLRESLRKHGDIREGTDFYRRHQKDMDEGARVAWPERFNADEASAIQHAMNLKLIDEATFFAEYQNEPLQDKGVEDSGILTADQIAGKLNGYRRGAVPIAATHLTAFIDVQQKILYWCVVGWSDEFTGFVVDYGAFPDQRREYFTLADAQRTLAQLSKATGFEGAIYAGLDRLINDVIAAAWNREDGVTLRVGLCLIDASWGNATDVVYQLCRQSAHAATLMPSHGRYFGPTAKPFQEWSKKPGDRVGLNWRIPVSKGKRAVRHALFDSNFWKTFVHSRLNVSMGDPGSLSFYGRVPARHRMISEHLTSETRSRISGPARTIDAWSLRPGARDNHLLDCVVGSAVAASILGAVLPGTSEREPGRAPRVKLSDLQRRRRACRRRRNAEARTWRRRRRRQFHRRRRNPLGSNAARAAVGSSTRATSGPRGVAGSCAGESAAIAVDGSRPMSARSTERLNASNPPPFSSQPVVV